MTPPRSKKRPGGKPAAPKQTALPSPASLAPKSSRAARKQAADAWRALTSVRFGIGGDATPTTRIEDNLASAMEPHLKAAGAWPLQTSLGPFEFLNRAARAVVDALADLTELDSVGPRNTLTVAGDAVSYQVRRHILLHALNEHDWKLKETAAFLNLGTTSNILRAIADLGLVEELEEARALGKVTRAWNKKIDT